MPASGHFSSKVANGKSPVIQRWSASDSHCPKFVIHAVTSFSTIIIHLIHKYLPTKLLLFGNQVYESYSSRCPTPITRRPPFAPYARRTFPIPPPSKSLIDVEEPRVVKTWNYAGQPVAFLNLYKLYETYYPYSNAYTNELSLRR
jgi:hypothetical protein